VTNQPSLFDGQPDLIEVSGKGLSIQEQFQKFHELNPWVYRTLVKMTRDLVGRGRKRIGMKMLFEVLRWQWAMSTSDPSSDFKLNNNYHSRYARLIMTNERGLEDAFETRHLRTR
jgi:hypothetical protein